MIVQQELIHRLFRVDTEAGLFFWRAPPNQHPRLLNTIAGSARVTHNGKHYWVIKIGGVPYKRGRLMFLAVHGRWPSPCVDHINGNSTDDRISNLREATVTENARNHHKRAKASPLPMGVRLTASGRYQARIAADCRQMVIGCFDSIEEARAAYLAKRSELFGEFA